MNICVNFLSVSCDIQRHTFLRQLQQSRLLHFGPEVVDGWINIIRKESNLKMYHSLLLLKKSVVATLNEKTNLILKDHFLVKQAKSPIKAPIIDNFSNQDFTMAREKKYCCSVSKLCEIHTVK